MDVLGKAASSHLEDTPTSLKLLLESVVDYAGMFPPASLAVDTAIEHYVRYRRERDAWMLGRFICPAARLHALLPHARHFGAESPCHVVLLSAAGAAEGSFVETLSRELAEAARLEEESERAFDVDVVETKWPAAARAAQGDAREVLEQLATAVRNGLDGLSAVYLELPLQEAPETRVPILDAVAAHNGARTAGRSLRFGAKMRCGGADASAFPSAIHVASFITACTGAGVPFKATAGLHHPLPRRDPALGVHMHGFLNVLTAACLAHSDRAAAGDLVPLLEDAVPDRFTFAADRIGWKHLTASLEAVRQARRDGMVSFGSCSFDEPREDLRALGLLS